MNATVYFLIEDNVTLQFSCRSRGSDMFHQPNVDPGPQSAQRGSTQDTNSHMSHIYPGNNPAQRLDGNTRVHTEACMYSLQLQKQTHSGSIFLRESRGNSIVRPIRRSLQLVFAAILISNFL